MELNLICDTYSGFAFLLRCHVRLRMNTYSMKAPPMKTTKKKQNSDQKRNAKKKDKKLKVHEFVKGIFLNYRKMFSYQKYHI